jgi:NAD/NADP transhydrogenase beta subunit
MMTLLIDFTVIAVLILGIRQFREPQRARHGNLTAAFALFMALVLVLYRHGIVDVGTVAVSLLAGSIAGYALARAVSMIQVPAMVAFQHGAGGVAAFLVALVELTRTTHALTLVSEISGVLGLAIGSLTFSGSMIASAKLANKMRQAPQVLAFHNRLVFANLAVLSGVGAATFFAPAEVAYFLYIVEIVLGACLGLLLAMRIGGADMPVLISSLNATAGLAAALCGMVIENQLLIAFGATVAASGSVLTYVMCKAMNRPILRVIFPEYGPSKPAAEKSRVAPAPAADGPAQPATPASAADGLGEAVAAMRAAASVIIVPGYGMARSQAQQEVANLAGELAAMGKKVKYAVHPVAGRMPGHMNVLLAEVGVDYDMLVEMEEINPDFPATDLVLVVGACDVVNPAAIEAEGTPISGMPILMAHQAKKVVCCNFDAQPGYSGVPNTLYEQSNTLLLEGDAKKTVNRLLQSLTEDAASEAIAAAPTPDVHAEAVRLLSSAGSVVIIPGYGMALAKAQFKLVDLAALISQSGARVKYAIHPVAGRMPGHMNVLLAEADVEYEDLLEMDEVNPQFTETDVALIVGACDVVNPAAIDAEGTPISGMPILLAHEARHIIVCNFDTKPGYSGVPNPLYENEKTLMLLGDAGETIAALVTGMQKATT